MRMPPRMLRKIVTLLNSSLLSLDVILFFLSLISIVMLNSKIALISNVY